MQTNQPSSQADAAFAALADPTRRAILNRLRAGPASVSALACSFPISRPAVSQHLKVLTDSGLTLRQACGRQNHYRLSPAALAALHSYCSELWQDALTAFANEAEFQSKLQAQSQKETDPMDQSQALPPIETAVVVPLTPQAAFELFTQDLARWWPLHSHSLSAADKTLPKAVTVDLKEGGQILETKPDGTKSAWARITAFEPGNHLALDWHVGRDEADATQVELRFLPHPEGCEVTLRHDGWGALGAEASQIHAGYVPGWDAVLGHCFAGACRLAYEAHAKAGAA
ncbi:MAG: metalloregulator ArsR/SmtB family transcription factor [Pseudomonadota bacterium]